MRFMARSVHLCEGAELVLWCGMERRVSADVEECGAGLGAGRTACGCMCGRAKVARNSGPSQLRSSSCMRAPCRHACAPIMKWRGERPCTRGRYASGGAGAVESSSDAHAAVNCPAEVVKMPQSQLIQGWTTPMSTFVSSCVCSLWLLQGIICHARAIARPPKQPSSRRSSPVPAECCPSQRLSQRVVHLPCHRAGFRLCNRGL